MTLMKAGRFVGAILLAIAVVFVLLFAVELLSMAVHPPPPDFKGTPDEIIELVKRYPAWVLAAVVPIWGSIAFLGTWLAGRLGNRFGALFVGLLMMAALACNLSMLPYPGWFKIVQPIAVLIAIAFGEMRSNRGRRLEKV